MANLEDLTVLLSVDYSQVELRMLAEMSEDPLLIKQFNTKPVPGKPWLTDVHCLIGHELAGWDPKTIKEDPDMRRSIKEFNFSLVFGVGKPSIHNHLISKGVKIRRAQSEAFYDQFFQRYKGVDRLMKKLRSQAEDKEYVETMFGFRRDLRRDDETRGSYWGNQAINTPIQGSAHNLVMMALGLLHMKPKTYKLLQEPVMEVHDALYWFVKLRNLVEAYHVAMQLTQGDVCAYVKQHFHRELKVPLIAEAKAGFCLGSMVDPYEGQSIKEFLPAWREKYYKILKHEEYNKELEPVKLVA